MGYSCKRWKFACYFLTVILSNHLGGRYWLMHNGRAGAEKHKHHFCRMQFFYHLYTSWFLQHKHFMKLETNRGLQTYVEDFLEHKRADCFLYRLNPVNKVQKADFSCFIDNNLSGWLLWCSLFYSIFMRDCKL